MARSPILNKGPLELSLGNIIAPNRGCSFVFDETVLKHHVGLFGVSGSGKSKLIELICTNLFDRYRGFCLIDPNGDTAEDVLAHAGRRAERLKSDTPLRRVHYLEPSFEVVFGFDPFRPPDLSGVAPRLRENAYKQWLHTKAEQVAETVQHKQGNVDFQAMARLKRILTDVLVAVGTAVNADGNHLPLSEVFVLLDRHHPRHGDVLAAVMPHLPSEIVAVSSVPMEFENVVQTGAAERRSSL